jgi:hypothetical protein
LAPRELEKSELQVCPALGPSLSGHSRSVAIHVEPRADQIVFALPSNLAWWQRVMTVNGPAKALWAFLDIDFVTYGNVVELYDRRGAYHQIKVDDTTHEHNESRSSNH